jgi:hypothetical protein
MGLMDGPLEIGPAHGPLGLTGLAGLLRSLPVSGRVMVDAVSFRERNPNYFFPQVDERSLQDDLLLENDFKNDREITKQRTSYTAEDMLLYSATVYGFYFRTKR